VFTFGEEKTKEVRREIEELVAEDVRGRSYGFLTAPYSVIYKRIWMSILAENPKLLSLASVDFSLIRKNK